MNHRPMSQPSPERGGNPGRPRSRKGGPCPLCGEPSVIVSCRACNHDLATPLCAGCPEALNRFVWNDGLCDPCVAIRV